MLPVRISFFAYFVVLSVLLLIPDPTVVTGGHMLPPFLRDHLTHFLLLTGLALLALASRWPIRLGALLGLLVVYAVAMEALQAFSPPRHVSLSDLIENLLGVAAGTAIWLAVRRRWAKKN